MDTSSARLVTTSLAAAVAACFSPPSPAQIQGAATAQVATPLLPTISVSATRDRRAVDETAATVTVVPADEIEQRFVDDIRDLVRNEPGVVVKRAPARFGAALGSTGRDGSAGFNIRGLEGNRVLMQVDGIRVPAAFSFGASSFGRGGYTDVSTLRSVEIVRGPVSSLYGSDGLAGAVTFFTFDPSDLLGESALHASAAAAHTDEARSTTVSLRGAARVAGDASAGSEVLAIVTRRDGEALRNFGTNPAADASRTAPNPQDNSNTSLLAKWVQRLSPNSQLRLTFERVELDQDTDVLSARSAPPLAATSVLGLNTSDHTERSRASLDGTFERLGWSLADQAQAALYWQDADTTQLSFEDRNTAADRTRDNRYGEKVVGLNTQFDVAARTGSVAHQLVYGLDLALAQITNLRDGTVPPAGETFPTKAFADSDYDTLGIFVQDEIAIAPGWFLTPALAGDRLGPALRVTGSATLAGRPVDRWAPHERARLRAVLPQQSEISFAFSALELAALGRYPYGAAPAEDTAIARRALQLADAAHLEQRDVTTLSGGERARVHLAAVFAQLWETQCDLPRFLLLDEPTAALDLAHQHHLLASARDFAAQRGIGVLAILHDLNLAAQYADRVLILLRGKTLACGAPGDVLHPETIARGFAVDARVLAHPLKPSPLIATAAQAGAPSLMSTAAAL